MNLLKGRRGWLIGAFMGYAMLALAFSAAHNVGASQPTFGGIGPAAFTAPTYSSPIAIDANQSLLWVVNPDADTVSAIDISSADPANYSLVKSIQVGDEPQSIALDTISATQYNAYVANAAGNSVTVINVNTSGTLAATVENTLTTGAEPWNVVASPDGKKVFVANSGQDTITVINTANRQIIGSVDIRNSACNVGDTGRHFQPRGMAVSLDNSKLLVTRFLSFTKTGGVQATDDGKEGTVCRFTVNTAGATAAAVLSAPTPITLAAQPSGFNDPTGAATKAYPNQMQSIVIRGDRAYLPNIAASPGGPLKFNVDTQAFVNQISGLGTAPADAGTLNLHLGARNPETGKTKLFFANPWAIAFSNQSGAGTAYAVSAGSDLLVKLNVDATGVLSFTSGLANQTRYIDLHDPLNPATSGANAGKNPLGIAIRTVGPGNNFAYVMNYISRNVSIVNLDTDAVVKVIPTTALPLANSQDEQLQVGKEIFFASRGVFDGGKTNRLSSEGWQNCASCHFAGLTDGNVWSFNAGPRKAVPLNGTWNPHDPDDQRILNYSAIFDEVQDFEANIRNVSGPGNLPAPAPANTLDPNHGLLIGDDGNIDNAPAVLNTFLKPNAGRPQLTVTLPGSGKPWPALDAMNEWARFSIRTPNRPLTTTELGSNNIGGLDQTAINQGRVLFFKAGCQTCHGGGKWSNSSKDFASPPAGTELATEVAGALPPPGGSPAPPAGVNPVGAQFLFNKLQDINSFNLGVAGGSNLIGLNVGAPEKATDGKDALGKDHNLDTRGNGFNVPSLLGIWHVPPYYHNGSCETLACVIGNVQHRTAKGTRPDVLTSQADQNKIIAFLQALDADTNPISNLYVKAHDLFLEPSAPIAGEPVTPGANLSIFGPNINFNDLIGKPITVRFTLTKVGSSTPINTQDITVAAFTRDFGQEIIKAAAFNLPTQPGRYALTVVVDSGNDFPEDRETDNTARREFTVRPVPPDKTAPVIEANSTFINDDAAITAVRDVTIKFKASDPASPSGQTTSGLDSFCVVRYYYNSIQRRWVEEICDFRSLPTPAADGTFAVPARLPDTVGVAYSFVWVKDKAGNISKQPGFDFINLLSAGERSISRNDRRILRIKLDAGQSASLTVTPSLGDVDVLVFKDGSFQSASANSGTQAETVTFSSTANNTIFQIEVRAVVNSRFSVTSAVALAGLLQPVAANSTPAAVIDDTTITVTGPPSLQAAIEGGAPVRLPTLLR
ncbi:MAG: beta-propeller fold lactonase family protein [Chloroflexota bacterium]|nr:beta-propeller fold lactonase family protein [Chloroflexota bacterium]